MISIPRTDSSLTQKDHLCVLFFSVRSFLLCPSHFLVVLLQYVSRKWMGGGGGGGWFSLHILDLVSFTFYLSVFQIQLVLVQFLLSIVSNDKEVSFPSFVVYFLHLGCGRVVLFGLSLFFGIFIRLNTKYTFKFSNNNHGKGSSLSKMRGDIHIICGP